jgi:hypothetical protein
MPVTVDAHARANLLRYAASIVNDPADATAVTSAAFTLMDWAEQAADEDDLRSRLCSLRLQWVNNRHRTGDAAQFVESAAVLYAFGTAADDSQVPR